MKKLIAAVLALALVFGCTSALACTGFYVGKAVSEHGTTLMGHTVDAWNTAQANVIAYPGVYDVPGRTFKVAEGVEFPLPDTTWAFTSTPFTTST